MVSFWYARFLSSISDLHWYHKMLLLCTSPICFLRLPLCTSNGLGCNVCLVLPLPAKKNVGSLRFLAKSYDAVNGLFWTAIRGKSFWLKCFYLYSFCRYLILHLSSRIVRSMLFGLPSWIYNSIWDSVQQKSCNLELNSYSSVRLKFVRSASWAQFSHYLFCIGCGR